ncbi:MAG: hypothetical protein KDK08_16350 [Rhizobiaceae bacterium]|nr:hypothetical protein [Rhizobiaceae bacterium]
MMQELQRGTTGMAARHRFLSIVSPDGNLMPDAFLRLAGQMLFPESMISAQQYVEIFHTEVKLGLSQIEDPICDADAALSPDSSSPFDALSQAARTRAKHGRIAGEVLLTFMQLADHFPDYSLRKAEYLVGMRQHSELRRGAPDNLTDVARKHFRSFWPATHLWAAWQLLNKDERAQAPMQGGAFGRFLILAGFFEKRLTHLAKRAPKQWSRLRPETLLRVPPQFILPSFLLESDPLRHQDIEWLQSYTVNHGR